MCYNSGRPRLMNIINNQTGPDGPWNKYYCPYCGSENMEYAYTYVSTIPRAGKSANKYKCKDCGWECIADKMLRSEKQRNLLIRRKKLIKLNEN